MNATIRESQIEGKVCSPSSKSYTHRALICSALAKGRSRILSPLISDDTMRTLEALRMVGANIKTENGSWKVEGGELHAPKRSLFCGDSGTTMRFMTAVCSLLEGESILTGRESLLRRPIWPLVDALNQLGAECSCNNKFPPVRVRGRLKGGCVAIPGNISSQFVSALLLVGPLAEDGMNIKLTTHLESAPYVLMTVDTQSKFGVNVECSNDLREFSIKRQDYIGREYKIEGDWSSAAFFLAAGAVAGKVEVSNLNLRSVQGDRQILSILKRMGAEIIRKGKSVVVKKSVLRAIDVDVSQCPDLFPIISVLCSIAKGRSKVTGISRLRMKECDRVAAMREGLIKMGIRVIERNDSILIEGSRAVGASIDPRHDHRIAMAFGIMGLVAHGETKIRDAECVSKSFPEFWNVMKDLKASINIE